MPKTYLRHSNSNDTKNPFDKERIEKAIEKRQRKNEKQLKRLYAQRRESSSKFLNYLSQNLAELRNFVKERKELALIALKEREAK